MLWVYPTNAEGVNNKHILNYLQLSVATTLHVSVIEEGRISDVVKANNTGS